MGGAERNPAVDSGELTAALLGRLRPSTLFLF